MTPTLDLSFVRSQFPAFEAPELSRKAFFESAGGSFPCRQVIDRLKTFYYENKVQPHFAYAASRQAGDAMDAARARLAAYLNIDVDECLLGPSTTQNAYVLANAFRQIWSPGDEVIVSLQEHEANSSPWRRLAADGIVIREWPVDAGSGALDLIALDDLLTERTKLVACTHASNLVGAVNPLPQIAAKAHAAGAVLVADGVSTAPHGFPDVWATGADVYLFSLYKTFGPHLGVMAIRRELADALPNQSHDINEADPLKRLAPAGPDHAQIAAAGGIADYFDALHAHHFGGARTPAERSADLRALMAEAEGGLLARLLEGLEARSDVRVLGSTSATARAPVVAISVEGRDPSDLADALATQGVLAAHGNFYAPRLLAAMGVAAKPGVLRLSLAHYTSARDVQQAIAALDRALAT